MDKKIELIKNTQDVKFFGIDNGMDAFEANESNNEKLIFVDLVKKDAYIIINMKEE